MIIANTDVEAAHPWPEGVLVQGGASGAVLGRKPYRTAFVEAFPREPIPTFIRGEGATVAEAETACWEKYQAVVTCSGSDTGAHGPFEPRTYENGAGYCTGCGAWFPNVCEPSLEYKIDSAAGRRLTAQLGRGWYTLLGPTHDALLEWEKAKVRNEIGIGPEPGPRPELTDADRERLDEANRVQRDGIDPKVLAEALDSLSGMLGGLISSLPDKADRDGPRDGG
jgi:hypothetical protein